MKDKITNRVDVMGYLRENNLQSSTTTKGDRVITGTLTVAFDKFNSIRINVYAIDKSPEKRTENKAYKALCNLLPNCTTSLKSQLEANPTATFDTVKDVVTKISAHCELQEYAFNDDNGKEQSRYKVQLLNWFDSIHVAAADKFIPENIGAKFTVDAYIESIRPEMKKVGEDVEETGRFLVTGLTPNFAGLMQRITYVTEAGSVSDYIQEHWRVGECTYFTGVVNNLMVVEQKAGVQQGFGQSAANTTTTTFIEERMIRGGGQESFDANEDGMEKAGFTSTDVKEGLVKRATKIAENANKQVEKAANANQPPKATKDFGFGNNLPGDVSGAPESFNTFDPKGF